MTKERCEICKFGCVKRYVEPEPLREPVGRRSLFGLIRWTDKPGRSEIALHAHLTELAQTTLPCMRYPKVKRVANDHWCGEYSAATS